MIESIAWLGVKSDAYRETASLLQRAFGLPVASDEPGFVVLRLPSTQTLKFYGPGGPDRAHQFASSPVMGGLLTSDLDAATAALEAAGAELLGGEQRNDAGARWRHFRGPDGLVYDVTWRPAGATAPGSPARATSRGAG